MHRPRSKGRVGAPGGIALPARPTPRQAVLHPRTRIRILSPATLTLTPTLTLYNPNPSPSPSRNPNPNPDPNPNSGKPCRGSPRDPRVGPKQGAGFAPPQTCTRCAHAGVQRADDQAYPGELRRALGHGCGHVAQARATVLRRPPRIPRSGHEPRLRTATWLRLRGGARRLHAPARSAPKLVQDRHGQRLACAAQQPFVEPTAWQPWVGGLSGGCIGR